MGLKTTYYYECIDHNMTNRPVAYCHHYRRELTEKLMKTHNCVCKRDGEPCNRLNMNYKFE